MLLIPLAKHFPEKLNFTHFPTFNSPAERTAEVRDTSDCISRYKNFLWNFLTLYWSAMKTIKFSWRGPFSKAAIYLWIWTKEAPASWSHWVCNVIFITASSSHDCVLFKFELACQHTNLIDFNSTKYNLLIFEQFSRSPAGGSQGYAQPCSP